MSNTSKAEKAIRTIREKLSAADGFDGRVLLLFSGGRDSSALACSFCRAFPQGQLHLLLIDNGLLSRLDSTHRQMRLIKSLNPGSDIIFDVRRVSEMMRQVVMQGVEKNFLEQKYSSLLVCVGCKLIMSFSGISYAREHGVRVLIDGYAKRQDGYPEQTPEFITIMAEIVREAGLTALSPFYDLFVDKDYVNETLTELGFTIPKQEPVCMWSKAFSKADPKQVERYMRAAIVKIKALAPTLNP